MFMEAQGDDRHTLVLNRFKLDEKAKHLEKLV